MKKILLLISLITALSSCGGGGGGGGNNSSSPTPFYLHHLIQEMKVVLKIQMIQIIQLIRTILVKYNLDHQIIVVIHHQKILKVPILLEEE